ncbi:SUN domain-containing ossification factor isoform X1 [Hylaeus anthracinus]|uniref:SUN domain-containing ossification factor isoform X1 n=2 Tax=Hylaeus anthracinus TaxID=313031 RepID=UPI0023B99EA6|nr:SUN domain-containing ossification factor isoform X1 [Hylaeus anthracinus]XP_054004274.1 SUN domain-containing ossification factor isoform X1 [Hylaeus anthracinus]
MRICITRVYWTLLFISIASSALLFIIVASENAQSTYYMSLKRNETSEIYDNDTLDNMGSDSLESSNIAIIKLKETMKLERNYKDHYYQEKFAKKPINSETLVHDEARKKDDLYKDVHFVAESLPQQPNLSQGISETEQATVLTLVNTAAAELQSLVEPKFSSEFSNARLFAKNSSSLIKPTSIGQETEKEQQEISSSTQTPSSSIIDEISKMSNKSSVSEEDLLLLSDAVNEGKSEGVVVVRAEKGPIINDELFNLEHKVVKVLPDEITNVDELVTTAPLLSDTEANARLMGHTRDEAATVVLGEDVVSVIPQDPHEDIPSFSEWTQKRLEEAEKKKTHPNASVQNSGVPTRGVGGLKIRSKNYASPDCGAKIVAANPEAQSARSVLAYTRDEYMLNTCTSRIWFVVELCEAIQAKKIELANFELFSSSPKDFSVYISDRFPTRDWSLVGQFTAKDVKDIQSFVLQPHLFGKFIKVELHTYYGSEHFCPVSLFRAYGTSEFEVLETETENQISRDTDTSAHDEEDSDEEEGLDIEIGEPPRNLFGSARDAVLSIVKKAAQVLGKSNELSGDNITRIEQSIDSGNFFDSSFHDCTTPRYKILCDGCSEEKIAKIFHLISCRERQLVQLLKIDLLDKTLQQSGFCKSYGVEIDNFSKRNLEEEDTIEKYNQTEERFNSTKIFQLKFLTTVFKFEYIAALCNILAIEKGKVLLNGSYETPLNYFKDSSKEDVSRKDKEVYNSETIKSFEHTPSLHTTSSSTDSYKSVSFQEFQKSNQELHSQETDKSMGTTIETSFSPENIVLQSKPTKSLSKEEIRNISSVPILESSKDSIEETIQAEILTTTPASLNTGQHTILKASEEPVITPGTLIENPSQTIASAPITTIENNEFPHDDVVPDVEPLNLTGVQSKVEKMERLYQEGKQEQPEILDQGMKLSSQDSLTFDTLLSDLKDLEGDAMQIQNGPASSASVTQSTINNMPQKESVFLRLSNRIKALERNMSLSGQYLEELSRRYKKQVEEMQRSLERTVSAMSEETRKIEERESKRAEEIVMLRKEIENLSKSVKNLLYDRDSWRGKLSTIGQHILLVCSEVFIIFLILLYCQGGKKIEEKKKQQVTKDVMRRKSADTFSSHLKKPKKRRPSEIASNITDTYREVVNNDRSQETKKAKRKKRKKETILGSNNTNVNNNTNTSSGIHCKLAPSTDTDNVKVTSRSVSSIEVSQTSDSQIQTFRRPRSVPENTTNWFNDYVLETKCNVPLSLSSDENFKAGSVRHSEFSSSCIENLNESSSLSVNMYPRSDISSEETAVELSSDISNFYNSNVLKGSKLNTAPFFMKTAMSTRKKRKAHSNYANGERSQNSGDSDDKSIKIDSTASKSFPEKFSTYGDTTTDVLLVNQSDESRSSSVMSMSKKKDRKSTGFRKMVRKFF